MGSVWPELIEAMPFRMGPMIRLMGWVPGALPEPADDLLADSL